MTKNAIITGASSGIGAALARELSGRGWQVALLARRRELLDELRGSLQTKSVAIQCDVTDAAAVERATRQAEADLGAPLDLAVANAGIGRSSHAYAFDLAGADATIRVNVIGMMNLFAAVVPAMIARGDGRFAGVASIGGLRGVPGVAAYTASKAAMQTFLEASRVELAPLGVGVTIINPGFVTTPMTAKNGRMPFLMSAEKAAVIIADGLERGRRVIEFPRPTSLVMRLARLIPDALFDRLTIGSSRAEIKRLMKHPR